VPVAAFSLLVMLALQYAWRLAIGYFR